MKDKLNKLFKGEGDNKKKIENLIFLLVILVVTIIAINSIWKDDRKEENTNSNKQLATTDTNNSNNDTEESLETKLESILSKISGVGKVDVMLTYTESTQIVPVYNKNEKTSNTDETDSWGGTRKIEESDVSQEVVYQDEDGKNVIATQKTINPKIEGAIITAEGAKNANIKTSIIQAVEAATGLATHKIQVFEKQNWWFRGWKNCDENY